jgi:signal peptidase II
MEPLRSYALLPSLNVTLTYNTGISFSRLKFAGDLQRWPLAVLAAVAIVLLLRWMRRVPAGRALLGSGIALVIGGAAGNLIDRLFLGRVVDFIQLYYGDWSFAVFNVADAAISCGVVLMILDALLGASGTGRPAAR